MSEGDYLVGALVLAATLAACGGAAVGAVARLAGELAGLARWLAVAVVITALFIAVHLVPGMFGAMSPGTVLACAGLAFAGSRALPRRAAAAAQPPPAPPERRIEVWLAAIAIAAVVAAVLARTFADGATPITQYDYAGFRMPNIADWMQSGTFWRFDEFLPRLATGSYPQNGDVVLLGVTLPFDNDAFTRFATYPFALVAGAAVVGIAGELGARRSPALAAAAAYVAIPALANSAFQYALVDAVIAATFGCGVYFLVRHTRTGARPDLVLAGIALGLALGTKWYGLTGVPLLLLVWAGWSRALGETLRTIARRGALLVGLVALAGGFWFLRNLVEVGNPVFPADLSIFGLTIFDAPPDLHRDIYGTTIFHFVTDWHAWDAYILPAFWQGYGLAGPVFAAGIAIAVATVRRAPARLRPVIAGLAVAALGTFVIYMITPYSAPGFNGQPAYTFVNTRWILHGLVIAAALCAYAVSAAPRPVGLALLVAAVAAAIQGAVRLAPGFGGAVAAALVLTAALGGLVWLVLRRRPAMPRGRPALAVAALVVVAVLAAGWAVQRRFNDDRYAGLDPTLDYVLAQPDPVDVGLTGFWTTAGIEPAWPLYGKQVSNHVEYVGDLVDGQLRPWPTRAEWTAAVERGGYDLLLVGRAPHLTDDSTEDLWAREDGYERLAQSDRFTLYRAPNG
ncbi:MAG: hypothetical protein QOI10_514 [Solirubrobacterales bacterium]|jgi:hypothetical protein|nr:hypothetical protein [Solirubrobacterales bacterium]